MEVRYQLQNSDCIIAVGSRFDDRTTGNVKLYAPKAHRAQLDGTGGIIHVNVEESEINRVVNSKYNFVESSKSFLENIYPLLEYKKRDKWFTFINSKKKPHKVLSNVSNTPTMEEVLTHLNKKVKHLNKAKKLIITTGVGNHQMQTYQFIKSHNPGTIISSGSLGVMGCGLPYAIGSKLANPDKCVILIDGDSSFNMTSTDLKTIVENKIPIKIIIMNNESQMMVQAWEKLFFQNRIIATENKRNPNFKELGKSYGIKSFVCDNKNEIGCFIDKILESKDPVLCEFKISKGMCFPLVAPGKALDDMITNESFDMDLNEPPS